MANKAKPALRYFYLNEMLHKKLQINRGRDVIVAWCYPLNKRVAYTYSDVRRRKGLAFSTKETAAMMNRRPLALDRAIARGDIETPQFVYTLTPEKKKIKYMFSEDDVMKVHEYFSNVHYGRPRKDGMITSYKMPTAREVRAMMNQETILYIQNENGGFDPTWKAKEF